MPKAGAATVIAILLAATASIDVAPSHAARKCNPMQAPVFGRAVPSAEQVLGFQLGSRKVSTSQSNAYLDALDAASARVTVATLATSVRGRPLRYAIVGRRANVTSRGLNEIKQSIHTLRDPLTTPREADDLARTTPAILWIAGNVHGDEPSGTDASLRVLHGLAARSDCAARQILDNAIVVVLPVQNPDGRETDTRQNAYGFDLNRDWFARTQPETDGKIETLREFPPVLFIDAHEMGARTFFFPPNADPIYHEITDESIRWINKFYGVALADEFDRRDIPYFNRDIYDLFYMGYGDTVPTTGFVAAGMTFEKYMRAPISGRTDQQYLAQWVSLSEAARNKQSILSDWAEAWRRAFIQGRRGRLEPNEVVNRGSELQRDVPDARVRHYFIRSDDPDKRREVQALARRLQRMDVDVYELAVPLHVTDYRSYGRPRVAVTLPAGTLWIPMSQMQKHWIQAMLNEDTYTPFPYFYDVTAWSQPLLFNVDGGYSGEELHPMAVELPAQHEPPSPPLPESKPHVGVFQLSDDSSVAFESAGWLRYVLERRWQLPYRRVNAGDIAGPEGLRGVDVLLVPDGPSDAAFDELGPNGRAELVRWVNAGGRYIAWRGGTRLAARVGLTTATLADPKSDIPGSLVRVRVREDHPIGRRVGPFAWAMYSYDDVMKASDPVHAVVRYPQLDDEDFFISGFASHARELGGTAAVVDEPVGLGRVVVFSFEPNFRAFTDGTAKLLFNAALGADPHRGTAVRAGSPIRHVMEAHARASTTTLSSFERPLRLTVRRRDGSRAQALLDGYGARYKAARLARRVSFTIANPRGLTADAHPFAAALGRDLRRLSLDVIAYVVP
jgi:hypothetical protein